MGAKCFGLLFIGCVFDPSMTFSSEQKFNLWFLFSVSLLSRVHILLINSVQQPWVRPNSPVWCHIGHYTFYTPKGFHPPIALQFPPTFIRTWIELHSKRQVANTGQNMQMTSAKILVETGENLPDDTAACSVHTDKEPPTPPSGNTAAVLFRFTFFTADIYHDGWSWSAAGTPRPP